MNESEIENMNNIKGKTLESNVEYIFKIAGFETYTNQIVAMYEIDVLVKIGDRTIILECKNYQNSTLTIRNLIHEWHSKNNVIKADKVILVLAGLNIKPEDYALANDFGIDIWDENYLGDLFKMSLVPFSLNRHILSNLDLKNEIDIASLYRKDISKLIILPLLSKRSIELEEIFKHLNHWVRVRARTDLRIKMAGVDEINHHVELFEDIKKKKVWIFNVKRSESQYWTQLESRLKNSAEITPETKTKYLGYMDSLYQEVVAQKKYFEVSDNQELFNRLIKSRINLLIDTKNNKCSLGSSEKETVNVEYIGELQFKIYINYISEEVANIISWLLTSEYIIEKRGNDFYFTWISSKPDETAEKVYRIFNEIITINDNKKLIDYYHLNAMLTSSLIKKN